MRNPRSAARRAKLVARRWSIAMTTARILMMLSASVVLLLGTLHLVYTFHGPKLLPRDTDLIARMQHVQLRITRETTVWRAWIGFNASHSMAGMLFGLVFAYLAAAQ